MESEHVKASTEIVQKTPEAKPKDETPEAKNQEHSSPPSNSPIMEVDTDSDDDDQDNKAHLQNPSIKTDSNEHDSSIKEPLSSQTEMKSQPPGYDPNRIPASIFSTKQGNNADWSTTSNESLFSIHLGNNSFSRDYAILFGKSGELQDWNGSQMNPFLMSGELPRLDEWNNYNTISPGKSSDFGNLPPVMEDPLREEGSVQSSEFPKVQDTSPKKQGKQNRVSSEALSVSTPKKPESNSSPITNLTSCPSPNRLSDASIHSGSSFAFPVLGSHDSGKTDSVKVVSEKLEKVEKGDQQPHSSNQAQGSKETSTAASGTGTRWFSCFSCWPRFC